MQILKVVSKYFFNKKSAGSLRLRIMEMKNMRLNEDFEVVSKSYQDSHGNLFDCYEEFSDYWAYQSIINNIPTEMHTEYLEKLNVVAYEYEDFFDEVEKAYRYRPKMVDFGKAKLCGFGVIRMMKGPLQDELFMYPLVEMDIDVQLFAYGLLVYDYVDLSMIKYVLDDRNHMYLKMVLQNKDLYEMLLKRIYEKANENF